MKPDLVRRMEATQKTVDKFKGSVFAGGKADCIQLVLLHARHMGVRIKVPKYKDVKGAASALKSLGFKTLGEAMDHHFERIDAHQVLLGDYVETPGQNGFSSLMVALGNGRALGFHEEIPHADILQPVMISGAWRVRSKSRQRPASSSHNGEPRSTNRKPRRGSRKGKPPAA